MAKEWEFFERIGKSGKTEYVFREKDDNSGCGMLIFVCLIILGILGIFSIPYKLIDSNFLPFKFNWFPLIDVWIFSLSTWVSALMIFILIRAYSINGQLTFSERFESPFVTFGLASISLSTFITYLLNKYLNEAFLSISIVFLLCISLLYYVLFKNAHQNIKIWLLIFCITLSTIPFFYFMFYKKDSLPIGFDDKENERIETIYFINSAKGANMRSYPSKNADIIVKVSQNEIIDFLNDSLFEENILWYKVSWKNNTGWISNKLIEKRPYTK
jgi:hypothetical protein